MNVPFDFGAWPVLALATPLLWVALSLATFGLGAWLGLVLAQRKRASRNTDLAGGDRPAGRAGPAGAAPALGIAQQTWIRNILGLHDRRIGAIMTPRADVVGLSADLPLHEAIKTASLAGFSRFPVFESRPEQVIGVFHAKDALLALSERADQLAALTVRSLARAPLQVPETMHVPELLLELQSGRQQMAIVVDEFGEACGVVTLEDLLEEIVGEIKDEHDGEEDLGVVFLEPSRSLEAAGSTRLELVNEMLGTKLLAASPQQTIGSFVATHLGRIPRPGETFVAHGLGFRILRGNARRIARLRVEAIRSASELVRPAPKGEAG